MPVYFRCGLGIARVWHGISNHFGMHKIPKNLLSLLIAVACALPLGAVVAKEGPNAAIALLSTTVTVLFLQVAFLRRDLSSLKNQLSDQDDS